MNMGEFAFVNIPRHLREMARLMREAGAKPELEVFDAGHIRFAGQMVADGLVDAPPLFQIVLGVAWGAPQTPETMAFMKSLLPKGANWAAFGISRMEFPMAAQAVLLGGHVRVGLEDNLYVEKGVFGSNAQLVEKAAKLIRLLGPEIATPAEARAILETARATYPDSLALEMAQRSIESASAQPFLADARAGFASALFDVATAIRGEGDGGFSLPYARLAMALSPEDPAVLLLVGDTFESNRVPGQLVVDAARHLGPIANTLPRTDPRQTYNHMSGRTSLMFTVPMFPAL
jgi:hypothetical protein